MHATPADAEPIFRSMHHILQVARGVIGFRPGGLGWSWSGHHRRSLCLDRASRCIEPRLLSFPSDQG
ncbi:hypothetical protein AB664_18280 [Brucella anthropi]|uniref:Uncharacterized protein n=1 Tax=Brucella anthropi TaxID=529 RepID=A0A656Z3K4_BRUAN|nr:hypothetical protein AB664_18280 [Brucella anthropi]